MTQRKRDDQELRETAWAQIARMKTAWPAHRWTDDYLAELGRCLMAGADHPTDITEAVTAAIAEHDDRYPPPIAAMTQRVSRRRIHRIETERDAEREATRRRDSPQPQRQWCGWLALAASVAAIHDRGEQPKTDRRMAEMLAPYLVLVKDLGYRNQHGCGDYRDIDGHLHPADTEYDRVLTQTALHGAEQIWRQQGMPAAPAPSALVAA
jgi:hypothetical protein